MRKEGITMAYPFRPVKVAVVIEELEIRRRRSRRKTDLFSDRKHPFRDTPTVSRKKLHVSSHR